MEWGGGRVVRVQLDGSYHINLSYHSCEFFFQFGFVERCMSEWVKHAVSFSGKIFGSILFCLH